MSSKVGIVTNKVARLLNEALLDFLLQEGGRAQISGIRAAFAGAGYDDNLFSLCVRRLKAHGDIVEENGVIHLVYTCPRCNAIQKIGHKCGLASRH